MLYLYWENPDNNRYYKAELIRDLLSDFVLIKINGSLTSKLGQVRQVVCADYADALKQVEALKKTRQRRGYILKEEKF